MGSSDAGGTSPMFGYGHATLAVVQDPVKMAATTETRGLRPPGPATGPLYLVA